MNQGNVHHHFWAKILALAGIFLSLVVSLGTALSFQWSRSPVEVGATIPSTTETITLSPGQAPSTSSLTQGILSSWYYGAASVNGVSYYWDGIMKNQGSTNLARLHVYHEGYIATNEAFADLYSVSFNFHLGSAEATNFVIYSNATSSNKWYSFTPVSTLTVNATATHTLTYSPYVQNDSNQYFAVGVKPSASWLVAVYIESITFTFHRLRSIIINDSASTLSFASNEYQPTILAHYNVGADVDITSSATYASRVYRNVLGSQSLSVSYGGESASKNYDVTNVGADSTSFAASAQAAATRDYIQKYKTCPGGVSDAVVLRLAKEYNAMIVAAKPLFAALTETVNDYDGSNPSQYSNGTYTGGSPSVSGVNIYTKLVTMVKWYNHNHPGNEIYLYSDSYYAGTDGNGTGTKISPVFLDNAGPIVNPTSSSSSLSLTLIIVASSGAMTLLMIAGIYLYSKKKQKRKILEGQNR
jgi:hypothetical protein